MYLHVFTCLVKANLVGVLYFLILLDRFLDLGSTPNAQAYLVGVQVPQVSRFRIYKDPRFAWRVAGWSSTEHL